MRIAVYTNTRVTFTCCSSVHKGFITAFRGGQVLGFCLVGLGVLNIMIIILLFKACWYNEYLKEALAAKMPVNQCEAGSIDGMKKAQAYLWGQFETLQFNQWYNNWKEFYPFGVKNAAVSKTAAPVWVACTDADTKVVGNTCASSMSNFDAKFFKGQSEYVTLDSWSAVQTAATKASAGHAATSAVAWTKDTCVTANADNSGVVTVFNKDASCSTWVKKSICKLWTQTTTHAATTTELKWTSNNCQTGQTYAAQTGALVKDKTFGDAFTAYETLGGASTNHLWSQSAANNLVETTTLLKEQRYQDAFPNVPQWDNFGASKSTSNDVDVPRTEWIWTNLDQLACTKAYETEHYKYKQRICVLTRRMFELVAGYGLGGSSVALFGRVGGGIYTKAADVGADLVGKTIQDLKEDDITNPGTIADNVGDNVGDIAGMGSDLFGSLAESTCAALVVSATSYELVSTKNSLFFPIAITSSGMIASWFSVLLAHVRVVTRENVQSVLKFQVGASTVIMTGCVIPAVFILPKSFVFEGGAEKVPLVMERWTAYGCVMFGLWSGMIIGFITEYYTNNAYQPTKWLADACNKGPAPNIILGLALGYVSVVVPIVCITATIGYGFANAGMYGIGLSALGMLGSLPVALSVDGYGPISDNAGGVAEMCGLPAHIRDLTDALDAAGNTTAAVGKGFAIGSACLVGLALFGAFITRIGDTSVDILKPTQFAGLLIGAMLPYFFTALTMKAVGDAAYDMMNFIIEDYNEGLKQRQAGNSYTPDYEGCIKISTQASLKKMVAPGVLVIGSPLLAGFIFGPNATAGVLAGAIVSGVQVAISQSNSGGAWDNAKKEVEAHRSAFRKRAEDAKVNLATMKIEYNKLLANRYTGVIQANGLDTQSPDFDEARFNELHDQWMKEDLDLREQHVAAVVGDTVGDPLKDTSGPAINILVKLSAITSLVFGNYLAHYHFFGNMPDPIHTADQLEAYCNTAGENPNTVDMVLKNCDQWLAKGWLSFDSKGTGVSAKVHAEQKKAAEAEG